MPVYGEGRQRREFLFVTDWVDAALTVLEDGEPGGIYNIGDGHELENIELARQICALAGAPESQIAFVADRPGHDFRYGLRSDRLRGLGWAPRSRSTTGSRARSTGTATISRGSARPTTSPSSPSRARPARGVRLVVTGAGGRPRTRVPAAGPAASRGGRAVTRRPRRRGSRRGDADRSRCCVRMLIVNLAAFTTVDACEADPARATRDNALGAQNVALAARACGRRVAARLDRLRLRRR